MGTAPGQVLYVGKILATEPLLGSVGSHLGGLSQSDILRRTVGCAGVLRGVLAGQAQTRRGRCVCVCVREKPGLEGAVLSEVGGLVLFLFVI